jgi:hypothetical protein
MLSEKLSNYFTSGVRSRGRSYFQNGNVNILSIDKDGHVSAEVVGSDTYTVTLDLYRQRHVWTIGTFCTCPYVDSNLDFCKHIWATLLAVEKRPPYGSPAQDVYLDLVDVPADDEDGEDESAEQKLAPSSLRFIDFVHGLESMLPPPAAQFLQTFIPPRGSRGAPPAPKPAPVPPWVRLFRELGARSEPEERFGLLAAPALLPLYVLETEQHAQHGCFAISLAHQTPTATGRPGKPKRLSIRAADINRMTDPIDRQVCLMLVGAGVPDHRYGYYNRFMEDYRPASSSWAIMGEVRAALLPMLFQTGRFYMRQPPTNELTPLAWDAGGNWELVLAVEPSLQGRTYRMAVSLRRGDQRRDVHGADWIIDGDPALVIRDGLMSAVETHGCRDWIEAFRRQPSVPIAASDRSKLFKELSSLKNLPPIEWPAEWGIVEVSDLAPRPELHLIMDESPSTGRRFAHGEVLFRYGETTVEARERGPVVFDSDGCRQTRRRRDEEDRRLQRLRELGMEPDPYGPHLRILERRIPAMLGTLLDEGWTVLGNRKLFRSPGNFSINVTTGIDWFELDGSVDFGGQTARLPELLAAARKGERFVLLGDGSMGMLPERWLAQHGSVLELGRVEDGKVCYARTQIGLIDALLAQMPEATFDDNLAVAREKVQAFNGIQSRAAPSEFVGVLRGYQEQGLAWLNFLNEFAWGGCLADDMGLGKTIQLLALLVDRKRLGDHGPSLVVMPKSIIFNWIREAQQFAPHLRVLDYTGSARDAARDDLEQYDLVFTTYGTMKRDIEFLSKPTFNYVVLDEAQAIKNPASQNAKAVRLLRARHRVVMTGTPVENHLGDLWSLFEFLNPGMLGTASAFKGAFTGRRVSDQDSGQLSLLHHTLRPFILRRTKSQVAPELPQRTEQTIDCTMPPRQAAYYRELRDYYRETLLGRVDKVGLAKSKVYVLEALLRLRQAACHPGLIDESRLDAESAKMDALLPMVSELVEEGHKALVFSQFTKMLAIVRRQLDTMGVTYEYLDGQTTKRDAKVDRFQRDSACPLFLISLKAGGTGLNLTAADYVFLLDPWWNPAVEAQAIDRTHRIGQDKSVIAYRIITRETVEAKILELQKTKRGLADTIITQANSLIQTLTRDDLAMLLS